MYVPGLVKGCVARYAWNGLQKCARPVTGLNAESRYGEFKMWEPGCLSVCYENRGGGWG